MADVKPFFTINRSNIGFIIAIITGFLLVVWFIETPPGILGKADAVGYAVCHRIDLRSFHLGTQQLPLCARCTGQYIGASIGLLFQAIFSRYRSGFPPKRVFFILSLLGLAYAVDGVNSYFYLPPFLKLLPQFPHLYVPSNPLRLLTGSEMGLILAIILYPAFIGTVFKSSDNRPALNSVKSLSLLIGICLIIDLLILTGLPSILYPIALISVVGVVILLSLAYTVAILRIFKKENSYDRFSNIALPLLSGFLFTMTQIALVDLIRYIVTGTWSGFVFG